ncbi:chymotrypsin-2-like [Bradysia coprophila]|uniref:chymotrypsin-2-like n=1 Tax=Bradysia coprophila TaxID=38358 RepID=UPI00187DA3E8|nr:chymotrypsin-2-like [Bradysia coprophila]
MFLKLFFLHIAVLVLNGQNVVINSRISGGQPATKPYPYQVSLQVNATVYGRKDMANTFNDWGHWCGGSIITNRVVVTAAHCLTDSDDLPIPQEFYSVFVGSLSLNGNGLRYFLSNNRTHPKYTAKDQNYDIGIITAATEITFIPKRVEPIAYTNVETSIGTDCVVTGWGKMGGNADGEDPIHLQELHQRTLSDSECQFNWDVTQTDICAFSRIEQGFCNGDSGGPLVDVRKQILVGIVSRSRKCGFGTPDIYVRVSFFYS